MSGDTPTLEEPTLSLRGLALVLGGFFFVCLIAAMAWVNATGISEEELAQRCETSVPHWDNYQEDIKGQVGARPVALWKGRPLSAQVSPGRVEVRFEIAGDWAAREASVPLLLKDPGGAILVGRGKGDGMGSATYVFELPESETLSVPWVEVQYPHHRERLPLDAKGHWQAR
jgi:hypothetical protein